MNVFFAGSNLGKRKEAGGWVWWVQQGPQDSVIVAWLCACFSAVAVSITLNPKFIAYSSGAESSRCRVAPPLKGAQKGARFREHFQFESFPQRSSTTRLKKKIAHCMFHVFFGALCTQVFFFFEIFIYK